MRWIPLVGSLLLTVTHVPVVAQDAPATGLDAVESRIAAHEYQAARDALLRWTEAEGADAPAALRVRARYLRAVLADDPATAERLLLAVAIDHPSAPEAADALLRVGQARYAAGEHDRARTVFDRLLNDYPDSGARVQGAYWAILNHLAGERPAAACGTLYAARSDDRERLLERLDHLELRCAERPAARDPAPPAPEPSPVVRAEDGGREVVAEVGRFEDTSAAVEVRDRLLAAGLPAYLVRRAGEVGTRVWMGDPGSPGDAAPFVERAEALGVEVRLVSPDDEG